MKYPLHTLSMQTGRWPSGPRAPGPGPPGFPNPVIKRRIGISPLPSHDVVCSTISGVLFAAYQAFYGDFFVTTAAPPLSYRIVFFYRIGAARYHTDEWTDG